MTVFTTHSVADTYRDVASARYVFRLVYDERDFPLGLDAGDGL